MPIVNNDWYYPKIVIFAKAKTKVIIKEKIEN